MTPIAEASAIELEQALEVHLTDWGRLVDSSGVGMRAKTPRRRFNESWERLSVRYRTWASTRVQPRSAFAMRQRH